MRRSPRSNRVQYRGKGEQKTLQEKAVCVQNTKAKKIIEVKRR